MNYKTQTNGFLVNSLLCIIADKKPELSWIESRHVKMITFSLYTIIVELKGGPNGEHVHETVDYEELAEYNNPKPVTVKNAAFIAENGSKN